MALAFLVGGTLFSGSADMCGAEAASPQTRIAIDVLEPRGRAGVIHGFPVSVGLVFQDGELKSVPGGRLVDNEGRAIPFEVEATGWWDSQKNRVKWLLLHFRADTDRRYFFDLGKEPDSITGKPIAVEQGESVRVSTGPLDVRIDGKRPGLFAEVKLNGKPMLKPFPNAFVLIPDGGEPAAVELRGWSAEVEEATPLRATVKATGVYRYPNGKPVARLDLRYQFFKSESFVRVYHTLTWMVRDPQVGAREISLRLAPAVGSFGTVRIGESDYTNAHRAIPWQPGARISAFQDGPEHFSIQCDGTQVEEGKQLGGWIAAEGALGQGVGVSLRHAWQTFPTALAVQQGQLCVKLWPEEAPRMGFMPRDIMPDKYYFSKYWERFRWSKGAGHFVHEYSKHSHFEHTAEGAARTHEMVFLCYDRSSSRSVAELNSITQHPVVLRQEPKSAMRVPFMGFDIAPVDSETYPGMERAIEQIGRMAASRWASAHDYGLWRFGMMRWGATGVSYRWMDGHQYDLQLIPWLLFMRGGGRRWFEEGEATARFAMDVSTTHYTTRGFPTGNQAAAAAMPFPWGPKFLTKAPKIHFLAYYYHLTGYKRAKEVMDEAIAGNKAARQKRRGPVAARGRELYNMNVFWANAYEETRAPEVEAYAREWLGHTMGREYNAQLNVFRAPCIYLYGGLILQHRLWRDERLKGIMLRNLAGLGYPDLPDGGVYRAEDAIACGWAYRETGDERFARVGWDIARTLADLVPDHDWSSPTVPVYPIRGNQFYRHFLMPVITGYSLGARLGMKQTDAFAFRDTFIGLTPAGKDSAKGVVFLRPKQTGDLQVRITMIGIWLRHPSEMHVTAFGPSGKELARAVVPVRPRPEPKDRYYPIAWRLNQRAELTIPHAREGVVYKLIIEGESENDPMALVLTNADMVQQVNPRSRVYVFNLAGQYYVGTHIFTRATRDAVRITNPYGKPFSVRDADTGQLLHLYSMARRGTTSIRVGAGRMLRITMTGRMDGREFEGVSPYFARTRESWFDPSE